MGHVDPEPHLGIVSWLRPDDGGRRTGPPRPSMGTRGSYAATARRRDGDGRVASYILSGFDEHMWESAARGGWLFPDSDPPAVDPGTVLEILEGPRVVSTFAVAEVEN